MTSGEDVRSDFSNALVRAEVYQAREVLRPNSERNPEAIFFSPLFSLSGDSSSFTPMGNSGQSERMRFVGVEGS